VTKAHRAYLFTAILLLLILQEREKTEMLKAIQVFPQSFPYMTTSSILEDALVAPVAFTTESLPCSDKTSRLAKEKLLRLLFECYG